MKNNVKSPRVFYTFVQLCFHFAFSVFICTAVSGEFETSRHVICKTQGKENVSKVGRKLKKQVKSKNVVETCKKNIWILRAFTCFFYTSFFDISFRKKDDCIRVSWWLYQDKLRHLDGKKQVENRWNKTVKASEKMRTTSWSEHKVKHAKCLKNMCKFLEFFTPNFSTFEMYHGKLGT